MTKGKISKKFLGYLALCKQDLIIVLISLVSVSCTLLMLGNAFKQLVDRGLNSHLLAEINHAISIIYVLIIIFSVSSFFRSYFINRVAEKIVNKIRIEAYSHLLTLEIVNFEDLKIGDLIARLTADLEMITSLITNSLSFFIRNSIMLIGAICLMFLQSFKLSLIVVITVPLLLLPLLKLARYVRALAKNSLQIKGTIAAEIEETFLNIRTFYAFNQQARKIADFDAQATNYLKQVSNRLKIRSLFFALSILAILFSITLVVWMGSTDIIKGNISSGQMVSFIYYAIVAGLSSGGIAELFSEIQSPLTAVERVFALMNFQGKPTGLTLPQGLEKPLINDNNCPAIEFDNVCFSYPARPDIKILNNISFQINLGEIVGIVGRSGAGKSTITQLLLKFYPVSSGLIKIASNDITMTDPASLRSIIGYVPQEPSIFAGTIRSNIAFSRPSANQDEILAAAEATGIIDFANGLASGLDTPIGERGIRLSGGQKQRIAIARAILYQPEILLLDEATSALDSESEQLLLARVNALMKGKTIISIAHRISSIEQADKILLIDQGKVMAHGNHNSLLKKSKIYKILCEEQLINFQQK